MYTTNQVVRERPPLFRALGCQEPPREVQIDGNAYQLVRVMKHDSWAATALYVGATGRVVCKFNRQQPIGRIAMDWLGRVLARHEADVYRRLADLPQVPRLLGPVHVGKKRLRNAMAHEYVPGHPLGAQEPVHDQFFPQLEQLLAEIHRRDIAYVDLHKRENVLVGDDGQPHLIDFQISFVLPKWFPARCLLTELVLHMFQQSDLYHLRKHVVRQSPELYRFVGEERAIRRPWWIRLHRLVAQPLRTVRRRLLVLLKIRTGSGYASTEHAPEEAFRTAA